MQRPFGPRGIGAPSSRIQKRNNRYLQYGTTDQRPPPTTKGALLEPAGAPSPVSVTCSRYSPGGSFGGLKVAVSRSGAPPPPFSRSSTRRTPPPPSPAASLPSGVVTRASALRSAAARL